MNLLPQEPSSRIAANLDAIKRRIAGAAARSGRRASDVRLIAVTKYAQMEWVRELVDQGVRSLGESRPQQFAERVDAFDVPIEWHFIGHLQRNKARLVVPHASLIHSVDSLRLLQRINDVAAESGIEPRVLLEVNVSGEPTKDGFAPDTLEREWPRLIAMPPAKICGLMTMAPACEDPEAARPFFAALRGLRERLAAQSPPETTLRELSVGMSGDYEVAIEEGATLVRIGSALFEGLPAH